MALPVQNVASILQNPSTANAISLMFWTSFLRNRYMSVRRWSGMPEEYTSDTLNRWLMNNGHVVLFRRTQLKGSPLAFAFGTPGPENAYGEPSTFDVTLSGIDGEEHYSLKYGEFVVWWDFCDSYQGCVTAFTNIAYFAELICACQRAVDTLVFWRGIPKIFGTDQDTCYEIEKIINAADNRYKAAFVMKGFKNSGNINMDTKVTDPMDLAYSGEHDEALWADHAQYLKSIDAALGFIPDGNMGSRDRVTATESVSQYAATIQINKAREEMWSESSKRAKKIFGVDITAYIVNDPIELVRQLSEAMATNNNNDTEGDNNDTQENDNEQ